MTTYQIESIKFDIPSFLETRDEDGTLVAYPPNTDFVNLRFTILTIADKSGAAVPNAGVKTITSKAQEDNKPLHHYDKIIWYETEKLSSEGSPDSKMYCWFVGFDANMIIVSCFIEFAKKDDPLSKKVFNSIIPSIKSIRNSK